MPNAPALIQDPRALVEIAAKVRESKVVAVDTEFIRETTFFPKIALLQLATREEAWLLDPVALSKEDLQPILEVFADTSILKLMHAAYADQECLYWAYQMTAEPVLDTAVAAALTGLGDNVGLGKLLRDVLHITLPKGRARVKWLQRPLPEDLRIYAEQDVSHLVELSEILENKLKVKDRWEWALEESRVDPKVFEIPPEDVARRIAKGGHFDPSAYPVLVELIRWREDRARNANLPRGWVADNEILVALAKVQPHSMDQLRTFRGLNAKEVDRSGTRILEAIKKGLAAPRPDSAEFVRPVIVERDDHLQEFIKTYVSFLADKHEIALRLLINTGKANVLAQNPKPDPERWVKEGILSPRAGKLIGKDLAALLSGQRGLILKNGKVEIITVPA